MDCQCGFHTVCEFREFRFLVRPADAGGVVVEGATTDYDHIVDVGHCSVLLVSASLWHSISTVDISRSGMSRRQPRRTGTDCVHPEPANAVLMLAVGILIPLTDSRRH